MVPGTEAGLQVRRAQGNRLEAQAGAPVVPGEEEPVPERTPVLREIRRANARTIADVQRLFPQAKLSRPQARDLLNKAFPEAVYGIYEKPEELAGIIDRIRLQEARTPEEIQSVLPGITPEQAKAYRDLAYPNAVYGVFESKVPGTAIDGGVAAKIALELASEGRRRKGYNSCSLRPVWILP